MRNLKKVLSVLLVVAMLAVSMVPAFAAENYSFSAQAKALNDIGLFNGVSTEVFEPDLGSALTREQGFALVTRLIGKADEAAALSAKDADAALATYSDAKDIEPSLKNTVAYAVQNKLVQGTSDKTIDPKAAMTGNDLATVILRNLGYTVDAEGYKTAAATLSDKGGLDAGLVTKFAQKELIRDDAVGMMYQSLKAKDSTGVTVIAKLIADKAVSEDAAIKAGVYEKATSATSMTAKGTGRDTITVTFNGTVDTTKAALTVKRGTTAITTTTTFADDKKSATLKNASKFSEGEYTITAKGITEKDLTATVSYDEERIDKIEFTSDKAVIVPTKSDLLEDRQVYVYFKLLNQYGEDVTDKYNTYGGDIKWSTIVKDESIDTQYAKDGKLIIPIDDTIDANDDEFRYGESIPVSVVYNNDEHVVTASTILTVASKAGVGSIAITKLYSDTNKDLTLTSTFSSYYLLFDLKDQYGNALSYEADKDLIKDDLSVSSTNNAVVKFNKVVSGSDKYYDFQNLVIDGKDYIALPLEQDDANSRRAGESVVTVVSGTTGKLAQYTVKVGDGSYASSFSMQKPDVAVLGEKTIIPFNAYDADGNEVTDIKDLAAPDCNDEYDVELSVSGADDKTFYWKEDPTTKKAQLVFDPSKDPDLDEDETVTLTATTGKTYKTSSISLKMKAPKNLETISGISSSYYKKIALGAFAEFKYDKVTVEDNYDRVISGGEMKYQLLSSLGDVLKGNDAKGADQDGNTKQVAGRYRMMISSSSDNIKVMGDYSVGNAAYIGYNPITDKFVEKVYFYGAKDGTATITIQMQKDENFGTGKAADWKNIADADYDFTMSTVKLDKITSIAVGTVADTYDYVWYSKNSNNYGLKDGRDFTNGVSVDGVMADGTKVWLSRKLLTDETAGKVENAYTVASSNSNIVKVIEDGTVAGSTYAANLKQKFTFTDMLNDDENETTTVSFSVVPNSATLSKASAVSGSFKVNSADPVLTSIALAYNGFAQLSADGGSIEISKADYEKLKNWAAGDFNKLLRKIVADAVVVKDQYGKEHDNEHLAVNANIYNIVPNGTELSETKDLEVTVTTNNGALNKTFTITIK